MVTRQEKNGTFEYQIYVVSIISIEMVHYRSRENNVKLVPICTAHACVCTFTEFAGRDINPVRINQKQWFDTNIIRNL